MQTSRRIKEIDGFPFYYACENGFIYRDACIINGRKFKPYVFGKKGTHDNYLSMYLRSTNCIKHASIHRIIALTFIPNPLGKPEINHINRIRYDNRIENLEWCTHSENSKHIHLFDSRESNKYQIGDTVRIKKTGFIAKVEIRDGRWIIVDETGEGKFSSRYFLYNELELLK